MRPPSLPLPEEALTRGSSLPCASTGDATTIRNYITSYAAHPNQLQYGGKALLSTFAGENCRFGQSSLNAGWLYAIKSSGLPPVSATAI